MSNLVCHRIVSIAIRHGFLAPAYEHDCVDCGQQASVYDHRDYNKPLEVEPVCRACNKRRGAAVEFVFVKSNGRPKPDRPREPEFTNPHIIAAVKIIGCREKLRYLMGTGRDTLNAYGCDQKKITKGYARKIEHITKGLVRAKDMRPDIFGDTAA